MNCHIFEGQISSFTGIVLILDTFGTAMKSSLVFSSLLLMGLASVSRATLRQYDTCALSHCCSMLCG